LTSSHQGDHYRNGKGMGIKGTRRFHEHSRNYSRKLRERTPLIETSGCSNPQKVVGHPRDSLSTCRPRPFTGSTSIGGPKELIPGAKPVS
jgi:hypothetical protein